MVDLCHVFVADPPVHNFGRLPRQRQARGRQEDANGGAKRGNEVRK